MPCCAACMYTVGIILIEHVLSPRRDDPCNVMERSDVSDVIAAREMHVYYQIR